MFYDEYVRLCNEVGKSPSSVAEDLGLPRSIVTRWKRGSEPRDSNIWRIANYFGVSVDALKGIKKEPVEDKLSETHKMLMNLVPNLSEDDAAVALVLLKQLSKRGTSQDDSQ